MKKILFISCLLLLLEGHSQNYIICGDISSAGIIYTNIPDIVMPSVYGSTDHDIDFDNDAVMDIRFRRYFTSSPGPNNALSFSQVFSLNNIEFASVPSASSWMDTISSGSIIDTSLKWVSTTGAETLCFYSHPINGATTFSGIFGDTNLYMAFRQQNLNNIIYGWFLLDAYCGSITIKSYAYQNFYSDVNFVNEKLAFSICPNPCNESFTLNISQAQLTNLVLHDVFGKEIKKLAPKSHESIQIDVSDLTAGIYFLQLKTNEGLVTKKIIVQH